MKKPLFLTAIMLFTTLPCTAGNISNGTWTPSNCGTEPPIPVLDLSTVEAFNESIKIINEWQKKANTYNECVIKEANADNNTIANAANAEQARLKAAFDKIKAETTAAKAKLDKK